ncbi:MAG: ABC transporter substrate-binding protein [Atribacterota bacterium]|nr:ABC transporter substrate-binding protein [Atribacterota bacterium]
MKGKIFKVVFRLLVFVMVIGLLVVCVSQAEEQAISRVITDMAGREVEIPIEVNRIITISPMATQCVFAVQGQGNLVGICLGPAVEGEAMTKIYPGVKDLPEPGSPKGVNIEELLLLKPDAVIGEFNPSIVKKMEEIKIPFVCIYPESPKLLVDSIKLMGKVLGKDKEAEDTISYFNNKMEYITDKTLKIDKKLKVYVAGSSKLRTFGGDLYQTYLVENAGGFSVSKDIKGGKIDVSVEQILEWDPDFILLTPYCKDSVEDVLSDSQLQEIRAIKNRKIYQMPKYVVSWDLPVPESFLGMVWLASKLYPEVVNFDMNQEIKEFYSIVYKYDIPDEDITKLLGE